MTSVNAGLATAAGAAGGILAASTPVIAAKTSEVTATPSTSYTTTHAFDPGPNTMVAVLAGWTTATANPTLAVKDSLGNIYTRRAFAQDTSGIFNEIIYTFQYTSDPGSITLTLTSSISGTRLWVTPVTITGHDPNFTLAGSLSASGTASTSTIQGTMPLNVPGSIALLMGGAGITSGTIPAIASTTTFSGSGSGTVTTNVSGHTVAPSQAAGSETVGWTVSPNSSTGFAICGIEVVPAPSTVQTASFSSAEPGVMQVGFIPGTTGPSTIVSISAGLASGTGSAGNVSQPASAGLAHGSGSAGGVAAASPAALAHSTGTALAPAVGITAGLATAAGSAGGISAGAPAGLAHAAGAAASPAAGLTSGLASGTGAAPAPAAGLTPGLAHAAGAAAGPAIGLTSGLASGTGQAGALSGQTNAGLATAAGAAGNVSQPAFAGLAHAAGAAGNTAQTVSAGLATAAGSAGGVSQTASAGLATAAGAALGVTKGIDAGLATGTGAAGNVLNQPPGSLAGLAHAAGTAGNVSQPVTAGLATAAGSAGGVLAGRTPGLAHAAGSALAPSIPVSAGLATSVGAAGSPENLLVRSPQALGGTIAIENFLGGAITDGNVLGGTVAYSNALGGVVADGNVLGGSIAIENFLGGTIANPAANLGGEITLADNYLGSILGWTMQQVNLALAEFNDETLNIALTSSGVALNLTGATVNMLFKTAAGTPDSGALILSSAGGSPAITITSPSGGLITVTIPNADLQTEQYSFYRIDVVVSSLQNTALYGPVTWTSL